MKLITEEIEQVEVIVENRNGKKNLFIEGVFLQGEIKNRNGRMYPMQTLGVKLEDTTKTLLRKVGLLGTGSSRWRLSILTEYLIKLFLSKKMEITL